MSIKRCANRPTTPERYHTMAVSENTFDEIKTKMKQESFDVTLFREDKDAVLIMHQIVLVKKG